MRVVVFTRRRSACGRRQQISEGRNSARYSTAPSEVTRPGWRGLLQICAEQSTSFALAPMVGPFTHPVMCAIVAGDLMTNTKHF